MPEIAMTSLFAREERDANRQSLNDPLALLDQHIGFAAIAAAVDAKLTPDDRDRGGRPPYPTTVSSQLHRGIFLTRNGQIIDASIVTATLEQDQVRRSGVRPSAQKDVDARCGTTKRQTGMTANISLYLASK